MATSRYHLQNALWLWSSNLSQLYFDMGGELVPQQPDPSKLVYF